MEKGHVAILEGIRDQDIEKIDIPEIEDLHISEYIVHDEPSVELSYQDLLIICSSNPAIGWATRPISVALSKRNPVAVPVSYRK